VIVETFEFFIYICAGLTVEQQSNPALAIASAVSTNYMTQKTIILTLILGLLSFNDSYPIKSVDIHVLNLDKSNIQLSNQKEKIIFQDSLKFFVVDDYPVTNEMLEDKLSNNSSYSRQVGGVFSFDKAWFNNENLNQTLVFELYTDYHRLETYHFINNDIPEQIIRKMELYVSKNKLNSVFDSATFQQKLNSFNGFIKQATKINAKYFTTIKGIKLGDSKEKAISIYGNPDKTTAEDGFEIYEWVFYGEYNISGEFALEDKVDLKGKPVAKDSFGNKVTMFFKGNKLTGQIIYNEIL